MGKNSKIEWTDHTWNPWVGCIKVSAGCKNCYMYRDQKRYGNDPRLVRRTTTATFYKPLRWTLPAKVFTCSWSDFFIEEADDWRDDAWEVIRQSPQLTFQILTKRPENIPDRLPAGWDEGWPNVWLGVSVENEAMADVRIPLLLGMPAAVRFLSCEPLLEPLEGMFHYFAYNSLFKAEYWNASGAYKAEENTDGSLTATANDGTKYEDGVDIHWVVCGGESGPVARQMDPEWARLLRDDCEHAGIPFFMKQMSGRAPIPADLMIRKFPEVAMQNV